MRAHSKPTAPPTRWLCLILACALACTPTGGDDSAPTDDTGLDDTADTDTTDGPAGGPCVPDSAAWSTGDWQQAYVDVDPFEETCAAGSGHPGDSFLSFDLLHGAPSGSVGRNLTITQTEPPGHAGSAGLTLEGLTLGQSLRIFLTDEIRDYEADVTLDTQGLSGVAVTWTTRSLEQR